MLGLRRSSEQERCPRAHPHPHARAHILERSMRVDSQFPWAPLSWSLGSGLGFIFSCFPRLHLVPEGALAGHTSLDGAGALSSSQTLDPKAGESTEPPVRETVRAPGEHLGLCGAPYPRGSKGHSCQQQYSGCRLSMYSEAPGAWPTPCFQLLKTGFGAG